MKAPASGSAANDALRYEIVDELTPSAQADANFSAVVHRVGLLIQSGEWEGAGRLAQSALVDGASDIRLIASYCLTCFVCAPNLHFAPLFGRLSAGIQACAPAKNQGAIWRSLGAVVHGTLRDAWELTRFRANAKDPSWQRWIAAYDRERWLDDLKHCDDFMNTLLAAGASDEAGGVDDRPSIWTDAATMLAKTRRWLHDNVPGMLPQVRERILAAAPPSPVIDESFSEDDGDEFGEGDDDSEGEVQYSAEPAQRALSIHSHDDASGEWAALQARIAALTDLVARGAHVRASALAAELEHEIEAFDPAKYFPRLFANYFRALTRVHAQSAAHGMHVDESAANALRKYSRADLAGFLHDDALDELFEAA